MSIQSPANNGYYWLELENVGANWRNLAKNRRWFGSIFCLAARRERLRRGGERSPARGRAFAGELG